ncbi:hypothetical protein COO60DRAFT_1485929 [Scenedesmus sp. NREL 46B-D3]|nr:hypothetical protein COO60DRAFT_1485929 [Scenedesmus sp. NREL 46B-D3]
MRMQSVLFDTMQTALRHHTNARLRGASQQSHGSPRPVSARPMVSRARKQQLQVTCALDPAAVQTGAYWALGAAGASFVGTFFVIPRFKDSFKEDLEWRDIYAALSTAGVKQLESKETFDKCRSGAAVLLDVRLVNKYESCHAAGSLSTPLYHPIQKWDLPSTIRRAGFAFFGIYGTELNTNFADEVLSRVPKGKQVVVMCENGGTLANKSGTKYGFQSRSLKAIYFLQQAGFRNVAYVTGGIAEWRRNKLPLEQGPEDPAAAAGLRSSSSSRDNDDDDNDNDGGLRVGGLRLPQLASVFSR